MKAPQAKSGFSHDHELFLRIRQYDSWNDFLYLKCCLQITSIQQVYSDLSVKQNTFFYNQVTVFDFVQPVGWLVSQNFCDF